MKWKVRQSVLNDLVACNSLVGQDELGAVQELQTVTSYSVSPIVIEYGGSPRIALDSTSGHGPSYHGTAAANLVFARVIAILVERVTNPVNVRLTVCWVSFARALTQRLAQCVSLIAMLEGPSNDQKPVAFFLRSQESDLASSLKRLSRRDPEPAHLLARAGHLRSYRKRIASTTC